MKDSNIKDELKTFDNTLDQILGLLNSDTTIHLSNRTWNWQNYTY